MTNNKSTITTLKKAASLMNTILSMVESEEYCIDILQQINAAKGLLSSAANTILENHLETCFVEGMSSNDIRKRQEMIKEIQSVLAKKK